MKSKIINNTLVKFLAVGVLNTIIGAGTMFLLYNLAHASYWLSSAANYVVGGIVSFFLNKYFTFESKEWSWSQVWKFVLNVTVCYILGYGLAKPLALKALSGQSCRRMSLCWWVCACIPDLTIWDRSFSRLRRNKR